MADIFLRSTTGSDANPGTDKGSPKATLASALTAAGAGGTVYVSDVHAELGSGSITLASSGTAAAPTVVVCVPDWGADTGTTAPTTQSTGGSVDTNGSNRNITCTGVCASFGVHYISDRDFAIQGSWFIQSPYLEYGQDGNSAGGLETGLAGNNPTNYTVRIVVDELKSGGTGERIRLGSNFYTELRIGSFTGTLPTTLVEWNGAVQNTVARFIGCDLSAFGSGKTLVNVSATTGTGHLEFVDCKLGASVTLVGGTFTPTHDIVFVNCDSADTNYRFHRQNYAATETHETTIVRSGGASDGTTSFSRKIATTANVTPHFAYESMWIEAWNESTGSAVTATVEIVTDNVTLTDAEAWLEVEYLGTSGFPIGSYATDRVSDPIFGTPANQTSSSETWTTTGLSTPVKQRLAVTFTPQEKGLIRARVCVAKASTTVYYDPVITVA